MQYTVERKYSEYLSYLTHVKLVLDAFCDAEHTPAANLSPKVSAEHIQAAFQLAGICVQSDMNRFYVEMDRILAHEVSHIRLSYKSHYLKSMQEKVVKFFSVKADRHMAERNLKGKISRWFLKHIFARSYHNSILVARIPCIVDYLAYVHYSDRYTPGEWDRLPDDEFRRLYSDFLLIFKMNLNHG